MKTRRSRRWKHWVATGLKYAPRAIAGGVGLFSLLLTHQFIWSGFNELTNRLSAPRVWLRTPLSSESLIDALTGGTQDAQETSRDLLAVEIIAPPYTGGEISLNGRVSSFFTDPNGVGRSQLALRPGLNTIVATTAADRLAVARPLTIRYRNRQEPKVIAWRRLPPRADLPEELELLGVAAPEAQLPDGFQADSAGTFRLMAYPGHPFVAGLGPRVEQTGPGYHFVGPDIPLERSAVFTVSGDRLTVDVSASIRGLESLRPFLVSSGDVLKRLFSLCLRPAGPGWDQAQIDRLGTMFCFSGAQMSSEDEVRVDASGRVAFVRDISLAAGPVVVSSDFGTGLGDTFLMLPSDSLRLTSPDTVRIAGGRYSVVGTETTWQPDVPANGDFYVRGLPYGPLFTVQGPRNGETETRRDAAAEQARNEERRDDPKLIDQIRRLERYVPERLQPVVIRLVSAIPFLYFLWILKARPAGPRAQAATLRAVAITFLVLHLSVVAGNLFEASFTSSQFDVLRQLAPDPNWQRVVDMFRSAFRLFPFLAIGIGLMARPLYGALRRSALRPARRAAWPLSTGGWILFAIAIVAIPVVTVWYLAFIELPDAQAGPRAPLAAPPGQYAISLSVVLVIALSSLWFVLLWLVRWVFRVPLRPRHAVQASWAMLLLPVVPVALDGGNEVLRWAVVTYGHIYPFMFPERLSPYAAPVIVTALGAFLLSQAGGLAVRLGQHRRAFRWWRSHRLTLLAAALVLSIPVTDSSSVSDFSGFLFELDRLLPYALLIGVVVLVRLHNPGDRFELTNGVIHAGALVFAWYVTRGSSTVLYIPVSFLMAGFLFREWLIVTRPSPAPAAGGLIAFLEERRALSRQENLQRGLDKKFGDGELQLTDYNTRLAEGQAMREESVARYEEAAGSREVRVFAHGPEASPMANARVAVIYGLVISAPFQLMTLARMVEQGWGGGTFPLLQFGGALQYSVVTWGLMAGVFGYFFHAIRGRNGFEKALAYSACMVLPALPLRLVQGQSLIDRGQILDIVQVVAFSLVLALVAFDLRTLQKQRFGWRELMTVYGLASAAYGSTVAIAIMSALGGKEVWGKVWSWFTGN